MHKRFWRKPKPFHYDRKNFIMTHAEQEFFRMLMESFGQEYLIFPQVHLSALLDAHLQAGQSAMWARRHIEAKSVDYILCDRETTRTLVAIELDDWSHKLRTRQWRDAEVERIFAEANIPLVRFHDYQTLDRGVMEAKLRKTVAVEP